MSGVLAGVFQEHRDGKNIIGQEERQTPRHGAACCGYRQSPPGGHFPRNGFLPARKGQQPLVPEVESLGIKIRSFDLLPVLRQLSNIKRFYSRNTSSGNEWKA